MRALVAAILAFFVCACEQAKTAAPMDAAQPEDAASTAAADLSVVDLEPAGGDAATDLSSGDAAIPTATPTPPSGARIRHDRNRDRFLDGDDAGLARARRRDGLGGWRGLEQRQPARDALTVERVDEWQRAHPHRRRHRALDLAGDAGGGLHHAGEGQHRRHGNSFGADIQGSGTGTILVDNNFFAGGSTGSGAVASYGMRYSCSLTFDIKRNKFYGGTSSGSIGAIGISVTGTGSVHSNYIYGGDQGVDNGDTTGVEAGGNTKLYNNLISGGGTLNSTNGDSAGIHVVPGTPTGVQILNNTIHHGYLARRGPIDCEGGGAVIRNNLLVLVNFLTSSSYVAGVVEGVAISSPSLFQNNWVYIQSNIDTYAFYCANGIAPASNPDNCPTTTGTNCYGTVADLNVEATTGGMDGTADGNNGGNPSFSTASMATSWPRLLDANGTVSGNWKISTSSGAKQAGLDGGPSGLNFGFTDDFDGVTRTGNGSTGWSIGAYEQNL